MTALKYDEVEDYQNLRSIGASEACWRFLEFDITGQYPSVQTLRVHLEGEQYVVFEEGQETEIVHQEEKATELTAFFDYNRENPDTRIKYVDFPKEFTWRNKKWNKRQRGHEAIIGRVHTIHPLSGDEFYLRILLHHDHCKGSQSFKDLRTLNGIEKESYKHLCRELGLLKADQEWEQVMVEAAATKLCPQCRALFVTLLLFCEPSNPHALFESHVHEWWDDLKKTTPTATKDQLKIMILLDLEERLLLMNKTLDNFGLPSVTEKQRQEISDLRLKQQHREIPIIIQEELNFEYDELKQTASQRMALLTPSQTVLADKVLKAVELEQALALFVDARGGIGKTFTLNTLLAAVRTMGDSKNVALAVASSGIAATLLFQGRTFHSRFKAPLKPDKNSTLSIKPSDTLAELIRMAKLIVWDEAPMIHKHQLEALEKTLQDIMQTKTAFGGKCLVLCGDFRQILPVVPGGSRAAITGASIKKSFLWQKFKVLQLKENMRIGTDPKLQHFDNWLLELGNGTVPICEEPDKIQIPKEYLHEVDDESRETIKESLHKFVDTVFPNLEKKFHGSEQHMITWIAERAILAPKNSMVDQINALITNKLPGESTILTSADSTVNADDSTRFPIEFLNKQVPSGIPHHKLFLKPGMVLMTLRNLNPAHGLCNGTRVILQEVRNFLLRCKIASGDHAGEEVLIPRIELKHQDDLFPVEWNRRQFPVRPAFGMTINKSQGQTLKKVGVWLEEPTFTHGQLYVAASRVGHPSALIFGIRKSDQGKTRNVVYKEIL